MIIALAKQSSVRPRPNFGDNSFTSEGDYPARRRAPRPR